MTKKEFVPLVDELYQKAISVDFPNSHAAIQVVDKLGQLVDRYYTHLPARISEDIDRIEEVFEQVSEALNREAVRSSWDEAMNSLLTGIECVKQENTFN